MNDTTKGVLATAAILVVVFSIVAAAAYVLWNGSVTWNVQTQSFNVYSDPEATTEILPNQAINLGTVINPPQTYTLYYYVKNTGDVAITVQITTETKNGCTASWTGLGTSLAAGEIATATLTLTVEAMGTYSFQLGVAP